MSTTQHAPRGASVSAASITGAPSRAPAPVLPPPPSDTEKYAYSQRNLPYLTITLVISASCIIFSQIRFEMHDLVPWPFLAFTATYVIYQVISLPVNFTGRVFDLAAHQARIRDWRPPKYPSVDIYLPICGEPIGVLRNTWAAVFELIGGYPGPNGVKLSLPPCKIVSCGEARTAGRSRGPARGPDRDRRAGEGVPS